MAPYLPSRSTQTDDGGDSARRPSSPTPRSTATRLADDEILVFFGLLVFAGNDTTRNTLSVGCGRCSSTPTSSSCCGPNRSGSRRRSRRSCAGRSVVNYFCRTATGDRGLRRLPDATRRQGDDLVHGRLPRPRGQRRPTPLRRDPPRGHAHGLRRWRLPRAAWPAFELRVAFEELLFAARRHPPRRRARAAPLELGQRPHGTSDHVHQSLVRRPEPEFDPGQGESTRA